MRQIKLQNDPLPFINLFDVPSQYCCIQQGIILPLCLTMQTFTKQERLSSKLLIDKLVEKGRSFNNSPFKFVWLEVQESIVPVQFLVSVPKRNFKKAVDRNKLKRRIREAYRKNKAALLFNELDGKKLCLMVVYIAKEKLEYAEIEQKLKEGLIRLVKTVNS